MRTKAKPAPAAGPVMLGGQITHRLITTLIPYATNARKHSKSQLTAIAASIQEFGFIVPILVDQQGNVLAGHARLEAAKKLRMTEVPTLCAEHLSEAQRKAFVIADNRLAELSSWDTGLLAQELQCLVALDFPVEVIGFATPDLDKLIRVIDEDEEVPEPDLAVPAVSRVGDLYQLGPHRLFCGDSTLAGSYEAVLGEHRARTVFTDPPYNVPIQGHVTVKGKHGEFAMASGEMSAEQFTGFLAKVCTQLADFSLDGSLHYLCMDWRHQRELLEAAQGFQQLNLCVWNKDNGGMGSFYRSKHELIFLFKSGSASHVNNVELGKHGRNRTNVWNYPGATSVSRSRQQRLQMHPTVKPVNMIADAILDSSHRDEWILDPFGGSGSTLLAAHSVGRRAALIELDPKYVDVTIERFQQRTGISAVHVGTGMHFDDLKVERLYQEVGHGQD